MTGPEHYREGETALRDAERGSNTHEGKKLDAALALAHFTAAQAAATALAASAAIRSSGGGWAYCSDDIEAWQKTAGTG